MKQIFTLCLCAFFGLISKAQPYGHLTIFSEDGDPFTLILNGETINDTPMTNLRVEELTQPYYNARIIFSDATKNELTKTINITDVDNVYRDVTYKIRRDKNSAKKMKLSYFSDTDVRPDFIPPSNVKVIHYGQPQPQVVTQTTTTTVNSPGISTGMSVQGMGVGINVSINEPVLTQTTTTTTTSSASVEDFGDDRRGCGRNRCMNSSDFSSALNSLNKQNFEDSKLKMAKQIAGSNCLSADQVKSICREFKFEESKLDFAKFAFTRCTEQNSYFKVNDVFTYSSSVDELTEFVSGSR